MSSGHPLIGLRFLRDNICLKDSVDFRLWWDKVFGLGLRLRGQLSRRINITAGGPKPTDLICEPNRLPFHYPETSILKLFSLTLLVTRRKYTLLKTDVSSSGELCCRSKYITVLLEVCFKDGQIITSFIINVFIPAHLCFGSETRRSAAAGCSLVSI